MLITSDKHDFHKKEIYTTIQISEYSQAHFRPVSDYQLINSPSGLLFVIIMHKSWSYILIPNNSFSLFSLLFSKCVRPRKSKIGKTTIHSIRWSLFSLCGWSQEAFNHCEYAIFERENAYES